MVKLWSFISVSVLSAGLAAAVPLWGQCGGQNWSGSTSCDAGSYCYPYNPFYSQCIPVPSSSTSTSTSTRTSSTAAPTSTGLRIRALTSPVNNFYLQTLNGGAVLGPVASAGYFTISGTLRYNNVNPIVYLNIASSTNSYKALSWGTSASFSGWSLEGDTLVTVSGSTYGRQVNFLACPSGQSNYYTLYLQTGTQKPDSACATIDLHTA